MKRFNERLDEYAKIYSGARLLSNQCALQDHAPAREACEELNRAFKMGAFHSEVVSHWKKVGVDEAVAALRSHAAFEWGALESDDSAKFLESYFPAVGEKEEKKTYKCSICGESGCGPISCRWEEP